MIFEEIFGLIDSVYKDASERDRLEDVILSNDASLVELSPKVAKAAVYIPDGLIEQIERKSRRSMTAIVGDNGDGKSTILRALEALIGGKYVTISELEKALDASSDEFLLIDAIDEAIIPDESSGELTLDPAAQRAVSRLLSRIVSRSVRRLPVLALTKGAQAVLLDLRPDLRRRYTTVLDLSKYRREAIEFVLARDVAFFFIKHRPNKKEAVEVYETLRKEAAHLDIRRRTPGKANKLYVSVLERAFEKNPIEEILYAPRKYHEDFEKAAVEFLYDVANEVSKTLKDVLLEVRRLGGPGEPDAEIVVRSPDGIARIAFEAKFLRDSGFSPGSYASSYPRVIYFVASAERPSEGFRVPYSLGYLMAVGDPSRNDFRGELAGLKFEVYDALREVSKAAESAISESLAKFAEAFERLITDLRSPKEKRYKSFNKSRLAKYVDDVDAFLEFIKLNCGDMLGYARGRYKFVGDPKACLEKLKSLYARGLKPFFVFRRTPS